MHESWLTVAEAATLLSVGSGQVRRMIGEHRLAVIRVDGQWRMPRDFLRDGRPLPDLRGTLIALSDAGFGNDDAVRWLLEENPDLGAVPLDALREGRRKQVHWHIQTLG